MWNASRFCVSSFTEIHSRRDIGNFCLICMWHSLEGSYADHYINDAYLTAYENSLLKSSRHCSPAHLQMLARATVSALVGNRTQINYLEGSYADLYTTNANFIAWETGTAYLHTYKSRQGPLSQRQLGIKPGSTTLKRAM